MTAELSPKVQGLMRDNLHVITRSVCATPNHIFLSDCTVLT